MTSCCKASFANSQTLCVCALVRTELSCLPQAHRKRQREERTGLAKASQRLGVHQGVLEHVEALVLGQLLQTRVLHHLFDRGWCVLLFAQRQHVVRVWVVRPGTKSTNNKLRLTEATPNKEPNGSNTPSRTLQKHKPFKNKSLKRPQGRPNRKAPDNFRFR